MKNHQKGSVGIIVGIIIAALVIGGGIYYTTNKKVTDQSGTDVTVWKTYTDTEKGFEVKYPDYYTLVDRHTDTFGFTLEDSRFVSPCVGNCDDGPSRLVVSDFSPCNKSEWNNTGSDLPYHEKTVCMSSNGVSLSLGVVARDDEGEETKILLDKIISTVKFTN